MHIFIDSYEERILFPLTIQFSNPNDAFRLTQLGIQLSDKSFELQRFEFIWLGCLELCSKQIIRCTTTAVVDAISMGKFNQQSFNYRLLNLIEVHMLLCAVAPVDIPRHLSD